MALTSVFYDGPVTETDRAQNLAGSPEYGVYGVDDFRVTAHPSIPYAVLVKAGKAHGHGVTDTATVDQVVQCQTLSSGTRWDMITLRRNWQPVGGLSTLEAVNAGSAPQIPPARKVGPGVEDDQPLFLVKWQGGTSAPVQFIDLRVWASNGGMIAKDDLVRNYLDTVGTEVNINGVVWSYQIGANEIPAWAKVAEVGRIPIFGPALALAGGAPTGTHYLIQSGTQAGKADGAGFVQITMPQAFPNGLLSVQLTNGDTSVDRAVGSALSFGVAGGALWGTGRQDRITYYVSKSNGQPLLNTTHRVNWTAIGW
jgi:hypothetical protein